VTLDEILAARRPHILREWLELIYAGYAPEAAGFFRQERDPFANPVGETVREAAAALYGRLAEPTPASACPPLERLMRLRAVEAMRPSQAVAFLLALKRLVRAEVKAAQAGDCLHVDLEIVCDRIDSLTLEAVDLLATYREKLSVLQLQEARRSTQKLVERLQCGHREKEEV
jgi:hypothetical protein